MGKWAYICRCTGPWGIGKSCRSCRCIRGLWSGVSGEVGGGSDGRMGSRTHDEDCWCLEVKLGGSFVRGLKVAVAVRDDDVALRM